jgi:hypothetical protein
VQSHKTFWQQQKIGQKANLQKMILVGKMALYTLKPLQSKWVTGAMPLKAACVYKELNLYLLKEKVINS